MVYCIIRIACGRHGRLPLRRQRRTRHKGRRRGQRSGGGGLFRRAAPLSRGVARRLLRRRGRGAGRRLRRRGRRAGRRLRRRGRSAGWRLRCGGGAGRRLRRRVFQCQRKQRAGIVGIGTAISLLIEHIQGIPAGERQRGHVQLYGTGGIGRLGQCFEPAIIEHAPISIAKQGGQIFLRANGSIFIGKYRFSAGDDCFRNGKGGTCILPQRQLAVGVPRLVSHGGQARCFRLPVFHRSVEDNAGCVQICGGAVIHCELKPWHYWSRTHLPDTVLINNSCRTAHQLIIQL